MPEPFGAYALCVRIIFAAPARAADCRRARGGPRFQAKTRRIRCRQDWGRFCSAHSQMRTTRQLARRKARFTRRSRIWLPEIFLRQKTALLLGLVACLGQPCQKQPSTKTAMRDLGKTKSGRTAKVRSSECGVRSGRSVTLALELFRIPHSAIRTGTCLRQPLIPCWRNNFASASSVAAFPRERMRDMTWERFVLEKTSAISAQINTDGHRCPEYRLPTV